MFPEVRPDESCVGEGDRRLHVAEVGPAGGRSSLRSGVRDRGRQDGREAAGGDLDLRGDKGDLAREVRSRSKGERDRLLNKF